jgi:hypothetical protein
MKIVSEKHDYLSALAIKILMEKVDYPSVIIPFDWQVYKPAEKAGKNWGRPPTTLR